MHTIAQAVRNPRDKIFDRCVMELRESVKQDMAIFVKVNILTTEAASHIRAFTITSSSFGMHLIWASACIPYDGQYKTFIHSFICLFDRLIDWQADGLIK